MIHEFALEPSLLNNWQNFRYLTEKFSVPQGRLISRYPTRWARLVYDGLHDCPPMEKKRIEVRLSRIGLRMIDRPDAQWDRMRDWLSNAELEDGRKPFHAILAEENPRSNAKVLLGREVDETNPLWNSNRSINVPRQAQAMAAAVAPLLRIASQVVFVDPYFEPGRAKWRNSFQELLRAVFSQRQCSPPGRLELHTNDRWEQTQYHANCQRLAGLIPNGVNVTIIRWHQRDGGEAFHNRYILTDLGGVSFQVGLDEGDPGETEDITLLDEDVHRLRLSQFDAAHPAFDFIDKVVVAGTRR